MARAGPLPALDVDFDGRFENLKNYVVEKTAGLLRHGPNFHNGQVIRKSGLKPRSFAPVQITQRLQKFGIKPKNPHRFAGEGIINFLSNELPLK
jgi:hypothetical protein